MGRKTNKETREVDARKLRKVLEGTGKTLSEASREIGRSSAYFSTIINCYPYITASSVKLIEAVFGIKPEEYIKEEEEQFNPNDLFGDVENPDDFVVPAKFVVYSGVQSDMMFLSDAYDIKSYNGGETIEMLVYNRDVGFFYQATEDSKTKRVLIKRATNLDVAKFADAPEGEWVSFPE